jgi:hypothetical protein
MSSPALSPDTYADDAAADGTVQASFNSMMLFFIITVLTSVLLCLLITYCQSRLSQRRALLGNGLIPAATRLGLSTDDIAALPTFTYRARTPSPQGTSNGRAAAPTTVECVVCLEELEEGDVVRVLPACRHFFHASCIDAWLRKRSTCPVCRADPEPERVRPGEAAMSPPLPQLRRCDEAPQRPRATTILADILARSPLRTRGSTSGSNERIMLRSPSWTSPTHVIRMVDEGCSIISQSPQMLEVVVVRSPSPMRFGRQSPTTTTTCVGVLERRASTSASPSPPATLMEESSSKLSSQVPY